MKDSQLDGDEVSVSAKYIKVNNERFSTLYAAYIMSP